MAISSISPLKVRWVPPAGMIPMRWPSASAMGTLERLQALVEAGLLDEGVILDLYGYRVANLINDDTIYTEKLVKLGYGWTRFIRLWRALDEEHRRGRKKPLSNRRSPAQRDVDENEVRKQRARNAGA
jgi:hypothetical protein